MNKRLPLLLSLLTLAPASYADNLDIKQLSGIAQSEFRQFSEDMGAALSYKGIIPAESLGITGFDVNVSVSATKLEYARIAGRVTNGSTVDYVLLPRVSAHKGLPFGFDVGLSLSAVPSSNIKLVGAEVRYALVQGGVAMPAVAARASYSKLIGVDPLKFETKGLDISTSKGFAMVTPYAGAGVNWVKSTPVGVSLTGE